MAGESDLLLGRHRELVGELEALVASLPGALPKVCQGSSMMEGVVGRESELRAVQSFLASMATGPTALLIEGEPGIGKTMLWFQAVRAAESRGFHVLQARPAESELRLSFAAIADLVGEAFAETRPHLPAPQERALGTALLRVDAEEPAEPRTTATALVSVLTTLAAERLVLVAVDDVQWLDRASQR
jgi:hypothetical protein